MSARVLGPPGLTGRVSHRSRQEARGFCFGLLNPFESSRCFLVRILPRGLLRESVDFALEGTGSWHFWVQSVDGWAGGALCSLEGLTLTSRLRGPLGSSPERRWALITSGT